MEFDPINKTLMFCAKRRSGKTELIKHIVKMYKNEWKEIFLVSPTEKITKSFKGIVKDENVFDSYSETWTTKLMDKMANLNKDKSASEKIQVLLILDDVCSDTNFNASKTLKQLTTKGRHYCITTMITCQYPYHVPPICRTNMDYVFAGQLNKNSILLMLQEFHSGDITSDEFIKMYRKFTNNYSFLIVNCNSIKNGDDLNEIYGSIKIDV